MKNILFLLLLLLTLFSCTDNGKAPEKASASLSVSSFDGVPIAYRSQGEGPMAVVFVHGWCIDGGYFQSQLEHLSDRYTVVTLDLAGHGASGAERTEWRIESFAQDVQAVVEHLGLNRVILVGHSMGDMIVTEAARRMPDRVVGLIGIDTFVEPEFSSDSTAFYQFINQLSADFPGITRAWVETFFHEQTDSALASEIIEDMAQGPPFVCLGAFQAIHQYLNDGGYERAVKELKVPVRTLNAVVPDTAAWRELGVDFQVVPLSGVGHYPMREDPEGLNRALDAVLKEWE